MPELEWGKFPRTPREFAEHHRLVVTRCDCGWTGWVKPDNLIQRLGPDFDLYDGLGRIGGEFPCERCGKSTRVDFYRDEPWGGPHGLTPFKEALAHSLELRAFAAARDRGTHWETSQRPNGKWRKFGPRK